MDFKKYVGLFINSWELGQTRVFGRIYGALSLSLILSTWLSVRGWNLPSWFVIVFLFFVGVGFLVSGFLYEKTGIYKTEINRLSVINPFQQQVLERLDKIEAKLK
jgi:hypothetical protein